MDPILIASFKETGKAMLAIFAIVGLFAIVAFPIAYGVNWLVLFMGGSALDGSMAVVSTLALLFGFGVMTYINYTSNIFKNKRNKKPIQTKPSSKQHSIMEDQEKLIGDDNEY